jgi:hypothetical protein
MQMIAPEILEDVRQLHPLLLGAGLGIGLVLWLFGARSHRFWLALLLTVCAGMVGLAYGREYGTQPLVAGLLLAVAAGALALALVRLVLFAAGGLAVVALLQSVAPNWNEPLGAFVAGGLLGVLLFRLWIMVLGCLGGSVLIGYCGLALAGEFLGINAIPWAKENVPLINWGVASFAAMGVVIQLLVERSRLRRAAKKKNWEAQANKEPPLVPAPPPGTKPPWWKLSLRQPSRRKAG